MSDSYKGDVYVRTDNSGAVQWGLDGVTYQTITEETFLGKKTVKLSTSFDARAEFASNFDVAKFNKLIVGSFALPGTDVTFAGLQIEVQPGATIDTSLSAGSSGNLKFDAPLFSTGAETQIVTDNVLPNDTPGSLTI
ncbi:MAG: hypothetical protein AAFU85_27785, partial [Planctomycetota bacterium]